MRDDQFSQISKESTDQNPSHDSDLNEDELLGTITDISVPGGHSDDSITLAVSQGRITCRQALVGQDEEAD